MGKDCKWWWWELADEKGQDITLLGEFPEVAPLNFVGKFHGK